MNLQSPHKTIEEKRQGEVLTKKLSPNDPSARKVYIETYGCQMNFSDTEIVASILQGENYFPTSIAEEADLIFINTCSIRENAEQRARTRLRSFKQAKENNPKIIVGVLGCMAERLKKRFLEEEKLVDIVVGPDAYRDLPNLIAEVEGGQKAVNVLLSREETYADISPVRLGTNGVTAFVSITRGCDNMCSFCVVPYTRGRERSRDSQSIVQETEELFQNGYREVTLLGQNVDSYKFQKEDGTWVRFHDLMAMVAQVSPLMRVRFSTSHPKDMTDDVLHTMRAYDNICKYIHLPVQSGNSEILEKMNRGYTREWYLDRIEAIRRIIPECSISTDIITGFCGETEEQHLETLSMMEYVKYDYAYMFKYSERPGTPAAKKFEDDVDEETKTRRLNDIIRLRQQHSFLKLNEMLQKTHKVLIEGNSKKSEDDFCGRSDQNAFMVFPKKAGLKVGDYVDVYAESCNTATIIGKVV